MLGHAPSSALKKLICLHLAKGILNYIELRLQPARSSMIENQRRLIYYYAVNALSWSAVGLYTVSLSWLVLATTHKASSVGFFYLLASASSLLISPFLGPLLGKSKYTIFLILASAIVRSVALSIPLLLAALNVGAASSLVFLVAIFFGPSNSVFGAASEGMMLRSWSAEHRSAIARRAGLIRQISLAIGFSSAGFLVAEFDSQTTSAIAAFSGITSALICLRFGNPEVAPTAISYQRSYLSRLTDGIASMRSNPVLLLPCVVATLGFSASQMSNALLAPIVTSQQKAANEFGWITSAWAVGAITAALLMNLISVKSNKVLNWFLPLLLLGLLSIVFSHTRSTTAQIGLFMAMGAIFSYLRISSGTKIALHTPSQDIAKVQLTLSNLISLTALFVYAIPWLLKSLAPALIFSIWGITIIVVSFCMLLSLKFFDKGDICAQAPASAMARGEQAGQDEASHSPALPKAR